MATTPNRVKRAHRLELDRRTLPVLENLEPRLLLASDLAAMYSGPLAPSLPAVAQIDGQAPRTLVFDNDVVIDGDLVLDNVGDVIFRGSVNVAGGVAIHAAGSIRFESQFVAGGDVLASGSSVVVTGGLTAAGDRVEIRSTTQTLVTAGGVIDVSGGANADAGQIVLWSDAATAVAGSLIARGGAAGGDGGFIEVSSAGALSLDGVVDTNAPAGEDGMLLLDPKNVTIGLADGGLSETDFDQFTDLPGSIVNLSVTKLLTWGDVTILANNDITISSAIAMGAGDSLTLRAGGSVLINASITTQSEALSITANDAGADILNRVAGAGAITMAAGTSIDTGSGTITLTIGTLSTAGAITVDSVTSTGIVTLTSAGSIVEAGAGDAGLDLAAGTLNLTATDGGATIGAEGNPLEIDVTTLNAQTNNGHIILTEAAGVELGTVDAGTADFILTASSGSITAAAGAAPNVTAGIINLTASGAGGAIGASGAPVRTKIGILNAGTYDGGIFFNELDGVVVTSVVARQGGKTAFSQSGLVVLDSGGTVGTLNVSIQAGGDVVVGTVTAPNAATVGTTAGALYDLNEASNNFVARTLVLQASGDIGQSSDPLDAAADTISASSTTGSIFLLELDGATLQSLAAGGNVTLTTPNGSLMVDTITAGGIVTLETAVGSILDSGAAVNITAAAANLSATTGIGTSADPLDTSVAGLSATVTGVAAPVYVNEANALASLAVKTRDGDVTVTFTGGPLTFVASTDVLSATAAIGTAITFENTHGDLAVGVVNTGSAAITLTASGAIRDDVNDAAADILGGAVALNAGTAIGAAGNEIDTSVSSLAATASAGGVYIRQAGAFTLSATAIGAGNDVDVLSAAGDMTLGNVTAPDQVLLSAGGSILDGNGAAANVTAGSAGLAAGGAIGSSGDAVETAVSTLSAVASGGGLFVANSQALSVTTATATGGALSVSASGNLTIGEVTAAGQTATLTASAAIIDGNGAANNITAGTAVLSGSKVGTSVDPIDTAIGTLRANTTAGGIYILDTTALAVDTVTALGSGSDVEIETTGGNMALGSVTAAGDDVVLTASGSITDANAGAVNVTAKTLTITAPGGIGVGDPLELNVDQLDSNGGGGGGGMINAGPLALTESSFEGKGTATLTYEAASITILDIADNVASVGGGSVVLRTSTGNIVFLDLNDTIQTQGTGTITVEAGTTPGSKAVAIVGNLTTAGGDIDVSADGNVTIGLLDAGAGDVTITSNSGVIVDGNGATVNIIADAVTLTATTPTARHAQLTTMWAIADASATRSEAAAKQTSADSFASSAAISAAAEAAAANTLTAAQTDTATKEAIKNDKQSTADDLALAATIAAGVSTGLTIAADAILVVAAVAQAVPITGDGGSATAAAIVMIAADVAGGVAFGLQVAADAAGNTAQDATTEWQAAQAKEYAAQETYTLSIATASAFEEASSIATAAAEKAAVASDAAAVVADWAIAAEDQGNAIGTGEDSLLIQANTVSLGAAQGSIYLSVVGDFDLGDTSVTDPNGVIVIDATGDITVTGTVTSPTLVWLHADGAIIEGGGGAGQVVAPDFLAQAGTHIGTSLDPIETDVDRLAAHAGAGGVFVNNDGDLLITVVEGTPTIVATDDVTVTASGSLTIQSPVSAPGHTVTLTSTTGAIIDDHAGSEDVVADTLVAGAATGITLDTVVANLTATTSAAGSITIRETDGVTLTSVQTANGPIDVTAGDDITATSVRSLTDGGANYIALTSLGGGITAGIINAGSTRGDVTLDSHGTITMLGGGRVTADVLTADAVGGMTLTTTANSADLSVSGVGGIDVTELDAITLADVDTANGGIAVQAGDSIVAGTVDAGGAGSDVTLTAGAGTITMALGGRVTGDALTADAATGIDLITTVNSLDLGVSGTGNISVDELDAIVLAEVTASDGDVTLAAGGTMTMALGGRVTGDALTADAVGGMSLVTTVNSADLGVTGEGDLTVDESDSIALAEVTAADGDVTVTAGAAITESGDDAEADISGNLLTLSAGTGIGTALNPIETAVTALEAAGGTGGVHLTDLADGLTIGGTSAGLNGVTATGGDIIITAMSPLTVDKPVNNTGGGNINLAAAGTNGDDDLTINADLTVAGGNIYLTGADDIETGAATTISAPGGEVEIDADLADADPAGSRVWLAGAIAAGSLVITTGEDDDVLMIANAAVGSTALTMGGGDDEVTVAAGCTLGGGASSLGAGDDTVTLSNALNDLAGGDGADTVLLKAGGSIAGTFNGGDGHDAVVYDHDGLGGDDYVGTVAANLQTRTATGVHLFDSLERLETTNAAGDTLTGANAAAVWRVSGPNAGNIGGAGVFAFVGFGNLVGGTADDTFEIGAGGGLSGDLNGGGGFNSLDYDAGNFGAIATVVLDGPVGGTATGIDGRFDDIDEVIGDADFAAYNSLTGNSTADVWTSTGINKGNIDNVFFFENFGSLTGAGDGETHVVDDGVIPDGPIDGGVGADILDLSAWTSDITWHITGDNAGYVVTAAGTFPFAGMGQLLGGSGRDAFIFSDGATLTDGFDGGDGEDLVDFTAYTSENIWTGTGSAGLIQTAERSFEFSSIEDIKGGLVTTLRFKTLDLAGAFTRMSLPATIVRTASGRIDLLIRNEGDARVTGRINVIFYLSADLAVDGGDVAISTVNGLWVDLFPGRTRTCIVNGVVPLGTTPGTYNVLAAIDTADVIDESNELNNTVVAAGTVTVVPAVQDLSAAFTRMTLPANTVPGVSGTVWLRVTNNGNVPVTSPIGIDYYLSTDGVIDGGDILLRATDNWATGIAAGRSSTQFTTVTIPLGTPAGTYNVLARVDADDQVDENHESNNEATALTTVTVAKPVIDLAVSSSRVVLPATAVPGDAASFSVTIENLGNVLGAGQIGIDVYASVDGVLGVGDVRVATADLRSIRLLPNGKATFTLPTTLTDALLPATYQWLVNIDSHDAIAESNEGNNVQPLGDTSTEFVWKFGNFDGRRGVTLRVHDAGGTPASFAIWGNGYGSVLGGSAFDEIIVVGTTRYSWVNVRTNGAVAQANNVTIRQPIGTFYAPNLMVNGRLRTDSTAGRIVIKNPPVVSVVATDADAAETLVGDPADTGLFTITRDTTFCDLTVKFGLSGGAVLNSDYTLSVGGVPLATNSVTMAFGQDTVQVLVTVLDDALREGAERVTLSLLPGVCYVRDPLFANRIARVTIQDNEV